MVASCNHCPKRDFTGAKEYIMLRYTSRRDHFWYATLRNDLWIENHRQPPNFDNSTILNTEIFKLVELSGNVALILIFFFYFTHLRMNDDTNVFAIADHFLEVILNCLLSQIISPLLAGLGESLLLARIPIWLP